MLTTSLRRQTLCFSDVYSALGKTDVAYKYCSHTDARIKIRLISFLPHIIFKHSVLTLTWFYKMVIFIFLIFLSSVTSEQWGLISISSQNYGLIKIRVILLKFFLASRLFTWSVPDWEPRAMWRYLVFFVCFFQPYQVIKVQKLCAKSYFHLL